MATMTTAVPNIKTKLPGPNAQRVLEGDAQYISPSYTRSYPLVAKRGRGVVIEDVDGNEFLDFSSGIAVVSTGHRSEERRVGKECRSRWQRCLDERMGLAIECRIGFV